MWLRIEGEREGVKSHKALQSNWLRRQVDGSNATATSSRWEREEEIFKSNMCHWQLVTVQIEPLVCALPQPHLWQHQLLKPTPYGVKILGKEKALESLEKDSLIDSSKLNREAKNTWLGWQQQLMIWLFVAVNCRTRITVAYEVLSSWCWQQIPRGITPTWEYRDSGTGSAGEFSVPPLHTRIERVIINYDMCGIPGEHFAITPGIL